VGNAAHISLSFQDVLKLYLLLEHLLGHACLHFRPELVFSNKVIGLSQGKQLLCDMVEAMRVPLLAHLLVFSKNQVGFE
jgi:hypothetical protein